MHPQKPTRPHKPSGYFLKQLEKKQGRVERESAEHDKVAPFLLPPAIEAAPTPQDKLTGLQKAMVTLASRSSDLAIIETVSAFLGRTPTDEELATRGVFITPTAPDAEGLQVCEFRFDLQPLFIRRLGFVGNEFRISLELLPHPIV